jgi:hypothetical protein
MCAALPLTQEGTVSYDIWKTTEPDPYEGERPCRYEHMSGECLICGRLDGEGCEWEERHR